MGSTTRPISDIHKTVRLPPEMAAETTLNPRPQALQIPANVLVFLTSSYVMYQYMWAGTPLRLGQSHAFKPREHSYCFQKHADEQSEIAPTAADTRSNAANAKSGHVAEAKCVESAQTRLVRGRCLRQRAGGEQRRVRTRLMRRSDTYRNNCADAGASR